MTERLFSPEDYQWIENKLAEENSFSLSKPTCKWGLYNACGHFDTLSADPKGSKIPQLLGSTGRLPDLTLGSLPSLLSSGFPPASGIEN